MSMERRRHIISQREVVFSCLTLTSIFAVLYGLFWWLDFRLVSESTDSLTIVELITQPGVVEVISNFGEIMVGLVAITLTVVTIIVELASNRYTPRIAELFIRDRTNIMTLSVFVLSALFVIWVEMSLHGPELPENMLIAALLVVTFNLLVMLPYFAYVFDFLQPRRIIDRIVKSSLTTLQGITAPRAASLPQTQQNLSLAIEQIGDIGIHSVDAKDKDIALASIGGLYRIASFRIEYKTSLPSQWFDIDDLAMQDQDFVALHIDVVKSTSKKKNWVERKVLRQMQAILQDAMNQSRDISHFVAIRTRRLIEYAIEKNDRSAVELGMRFLNTYIRFAINSSDVRTVYNLFNELRLLAEELLNAKEDQLVIEVANYMKFYGHLGFNRNMPFVLECAAYDLSSVIEKAWHQQSSIHDLLLAILLDVDREPREHSQEASLRGVRKAQARLATLYLLEKVPVKARQIFDDMKEEPIERIASIEEEMLDITVAEYWEVSDRGKNFDYLPSERRAFLSVFFSWFLEM